MRRPVFVLALLAVLLVPAVLTPRSVAACSTSGPWDRVAQSDIIIAGWVVQMRLAPLDLGIEYSRRGPTTSYQAGEFYPVWVDFEVEHYFKGSGPQTLSALDPRSVVFLAGQTNEERATFEGAAFIGSGGSCGSLDEDPRGQFWVVGLTIDEAGRPTLNRLTTFTTPNADPQSAEILTAIDDLEDRLGPGVTPAATGHGTPAPDESGTLLLVLGATGIVLLGISRLAGGRR